MGSQITINDTLRITREQGFPTALDYETHKNKPFEAGDFEGQIFEFTKPDIRIYKTPPVRNFLVEDVDGKWLYWGRIHVLELHHDNIKNATSGKFKIIQIYSPDEMPLAHKLIDGRDEVNFFE